MNRVGHAAVILIASALFIAVDLWSCKASAQMPIDLGRQIWIAPSVCEQGGAVEWRLLLGGQLPWRSPDWKTPLGGCWRIPSIAVWDSWARGMLQARCVFGDERENQAWYTVSNVVTIVASDGRCD